MSPRSTHALHKRSDLEHLAPVVLVGLQGSHFGGQRGTPPHAAGAVEDRASYCLGPADAMTSVYRVLSYASARPRGTRQEPAFALHEAPRHWCRNRLTWN